MDGPISGQLAELQTAIEQLMFDCGRIANEVGAARDTAYDSQDDIDAAEKSIKDVSYHLVTFSHVLKRNC